MGSSNSKARRISDGKYSELQYHTPRGSIPAQMTTHSAQNAPAPGPKTKSRYPSQYRNEEGQGANVYPLYHPWETRGAHSEGLVEHPTKLHGQPGFDPHRKAKSKTAVEVVIHKNDRKLVVANPPNNAGPFRTVTNQSHQVVMGVNYQPGGNATGYARAPLAPRDRQGRQQLEAHKKKMAKKSNTH